MYLLKTIVTIKSLIIIIEQSDWVRQGSTTNWIQIDIWRQNSCPIANEQVNGSSGAGQLGLGTRTLHMHITLHPIQEYLPYRYNTFVDEERISYKERI